jgi:putative DNA primase/helicase
MNQSAAFRDAIAAAGLTPPHEIIGDGERHRFSSDGRPNNKSGWYIFHDDERPAGAFGCWRSEISSTWKSSKPQQFTDAEREEYRERMKRLEKQRERERQEATDYAAVTAAQMWNEAIEADHPYLTRKQITCLGARVLGDVLLVPMKHSAKELVGLQRIWPDGTKRFIKGSPLAGAYMTIGTPTKDGTVVICEGYATGVSIHLATSYCVVVAFNSGNLSEVVNKIRRALPSARLIIAGDDDAFTVRPGNHPQAGMPWNPGIEAATATGFPVYLPAWQGERERGTDFNDLHVAEGLKAVRKCFRDPATLGTNPGAVSDKPPVQPVSDGGYRGPDNSGSSGGESPFASDQAVHHESAPPVILPGGGSDVASVPMIVPRHMAVSHYGLDASERGPYATVANIKRVILLDPQIEKTIWFDEFMDRVMTVWGGGKPREWSDVDDINLQIYLQESLCMPKLGKSAVQDAVISAAHTDTRNEAKAYIESVQWDGVERLGSFMHQIFGAEDNEYTRAAGQNFWISMVARVMRPGCKVDTMIVLEGIQGAGKSRALSMIGGQWFAEANQSPTDKDFYLNLAGKMLIEIGEMDAFNRSEVTKVKQVITCQTDRYRAPYERRAADHPRRCVFAGTTNRDDWNKDETGARRFWPVYCTAINHTMLMDNRDQYFAEAAAKLNQGANWWDMPEDATKQQQEARRDSDELESVLADWLLGKSEITVHSIMADLMQVPLERQDKSLQMRIAKALRALKWHKPAAPVWRGGKTTRVWVKPITFIDVPHSDPFGDE